MKICPECQTENKQSARFCRGCGHLFEQKAVDPNATRRLPDVMIDPSAVDPKATDYFADDTTADPHATRHLSDLEQRDSNATRRLPLDVESDPNATEYVVEKNTPDPNATRRLNDTPPPVVTSKVTRRLDDAAPPPFPAQPPPYQPQAPTQPPPTPTYQQPTAAFDPAAAEQKTSGDSRRWLLLGGGVLGVVALLGIVWAVWRAVSGGEAYMLVGFPDRRGEYDLYTLKPGESEDDATVMREEILLRDGWSSVSFYSEESGYQSASEIGGFLPADDQLFLVYQDDDEVVLHQMSIGDPEGTTLIDSDDNIGVRIFSDQSLIGITEYRDGDNRCYVARYNEEAERIAKGDECIFMNDGSAVFVTERDDDLLTMRAMDMDGENEVVVIESEEPIGSRRISYDGSHVAYVKTTDDGQQLYFVSRADAEESAISGNFFSIIDFNFAIEQDSLYYIGETDEGTLQLYTTKSTEPLAEGAFLTAVIDNQGEYLAYLVGDDEDDLTAFVADLENDTQTELVSGEKLRLQLLRDAERILIFEETEDGDNVLYSSDFSGDEVIELYDDEAISESRFTFRGNNLYLTVVDGGDSSLLVTSLDGETDFLAIDEFASFEVESISADEEWMLFSGREDNNDDLILYSLRLDGSSRPIEIDDDADEIVNAFFDSSNTSVIYTVRTGNDSDDVSVMQADLEGEESPETLYDEAILFDVQWQNNLPLYRLFFSSAYSGTAFCPGSDVLTVGSEYRGEVADATEPTCLRFRADSGSVLTLDVTTDPEDNLDLWLELFDRDGNSIQYNGGLADRLDDPGISYYFEEGGVYFVQAGHFFSDETAEFTLQLSADVPYEGFSEARELTESNSPLREAFTESVYFEVYEVGFPAGSYYIEGEQGDAITIEIAAASIGSEAIPGFVLVDLEWEVLIDDNGEDGDFQIEYILPETGRYYLIAASDDTGSTDTHFYEISLSK